MQRDPVPDAPGSPPLPRPLSLYEILAVILLWHVTVPAVFGAIGSLFGLAPVFWASSAMLALGGYTDRARRAG